MPARFQIRDPKTFHQWMRNEFGERLFPIFFKTYTEKVWGMGGPANQGAQYFEGIR